MVPLDNVKVCHLLFKRGQSQFAKRPNVYAAFFSLLSVPVHIQVVFPGMPIDI